MKSARSKLNRAGLVSPRTAQVAEWFGLTDRVVDPYQTLAQASLAEDVVPRPGEVVLLTGASGSGKSSVLRAVVESIRSGSNAARVFDCCIDLTALQCPELPMVDCFGQTPLPIVLGLLSRVGLAEAWSFLRTPTRLSEGQRWRLKLAMAIFEAGNASSPEEKSPEALSRSVDSTTSIGTHSSPVPRKVLLMADEFCAVLDRVTAAVVARVLRRTIDGSPNLAAVVATSHDDLTVALQPDRIVRCDFGSMSIEHRKRSSDFKI